MNILIDMDGIAADMLGPWLRIINKKTGLSLRAEHVDQWSILPFIPKWYRQEVFAELDQPDFFYKLPPMAGAVDTITQLYQDGHEIKFCTTPAGPESCKDKVRWVKKHFGHLCWDHHDMVFIADKHRVNADLLIDDRPSTLREWGPSSGPKRMATIRHPYNSDVCDKSTHVFVAEDYLDTQSAWEQLYRWISRQRVR